MELYQIYRPITATPFRNNGNYTEVEPCSALKPYIRCFWGTASPQHASLASDPDSMGLPALPHSSGIKISALPHSDGIKMPALPHSDGIKMSAYPHSDSIKMSALPHSDSIKMSAHHHSGGFHPAGENVFKSLSAPDNCGPGSGAYNIITPDTCADIIFHVDFTAGTIESAFCGINDSSFQSDIAKEPDSKTAEFAIRFYAWSVVVFAEEGLRDSRNIHCDAGYYFPGLKKALEDKVWNKCSSKLSIGAVSRAGPRYAGV